VADLKNTARAGAPHPASVPAGFHRAGPGLGHLDIAARVWKLTTAGAGIQPVHGVRRAQPLSSG